MFLVKKSYCIIYAREILFYDYKQLTEYLSDKICCAEDDD